MRKISNLKYLKSKLNRYRTIRNKANKYYTKYFKKMDFSTLTESEKLQYLEVKYGGYQDSYFQTLIDNKNVRLRKGNHYGGDRFNVFFHDYSDVYTKYLENFKSEFTNLLEIGILSGIGLAIWSDYLPTTKIYGFDWDLNNFNNNYQNLIALGAFKNSKPLTFRYDQFTENSQWLKKEFENIKFQIIIDDAHHSDKAILNSFYELKPYLSDNFIYFIEDNTTVYKKIMKENPEFKVKNYGEITVIICL